MKKISALLMTVLYLVISPATVLAVGATLSLSPSNGTFGQGCSVSLDVKVDTGGAQTDGVDAILTYDPSRFTVKGIRNGTIYAEYPGNVIDPAAGKIIISGLASANSAFSGAGTLASVDLQVTAASPTGLTQIKFDFDPADKAKTSDSNVAERGTVSDILNQVVDGSYTIGTGSCTGAGTGTGATGSGTIQPTPIPDDLIKKPLPDAGSFGTTLVITAVGGVLTILGILGLAIL